MFEFWRGKIKSCLLLILGILDCKRPNQNSCQIRLVIICHVNAL